MARGAETKSIISKKILETFSGAFLYNDGKEIRIPMKENGEDIQIKVTLTAAKENVNCGDDNLLPGENNIEDTNVNINNENISTEPSQEELNNVNNLLKALGL